MKKVLLLLLVIPFQLVSLPESRCTYKACGYNAVSKAPETFPKCVQFDFLEYNFGELILKEKVIAVFRFQNISDIAIRISQVKTSSGCLVPKWPKEEILSGETAAIEFLYDAQPAGLFSKSATVYVEGFKNDPIILRVKGKVVESAF